MKETTVDLWIKDFIELTDTQFERFEQAIKSERGFWLYDIKEKKIYLSDGVVYLTIQSENIEDYVQKLLAENEFIHLLNLAKESIENKQNGFSIRVKLKEGR
ncbi:hypothetical protein [Caldicellulosiruptor naganoensis]|uniref:Uncharacterized protein n=1 Tax=Caldicellulosiruptor naganoensis TaxID=29324 RepID=A0ABY7BIR0_9FIRM|nr:hypothetical protein [Caldicellulosiruptor naganoensis]WAM31239.1 hypothetical protein OTJ99_002074 [Caldicellulosiruptor naganoensis]